MSIRHILKNFLKRLKCKCKSNCCSKQIEIVVVDSAPEEPDGISSLKITSL